MVSEVRRGLGGLQREGFRQVWKLSSADSIEATTVTRHPLWTDKRHDAGPFDIIGDIHGCAGELQALLGTLGYRVEWSHDRGDRKVSVTPPEGRKVVFVGDLVDRGPNTPDALRIAMSMTAAGTAYAVQGNHERKLERWLTGRKVTVAHGLQQTIDQLDGQDRALREEPSGLPRRPAQPRLARRRAARRRPRRAEGGDDRPRLRRGAGVRPLRRDHRRDRRVRPARPRRLGGGLPRQDHRRLRPHPGAPRGLGEQHDLHRHRLRFRRQADRAALARERTGRRSGRAHVVRADPTRSAASPTPGRRRPMRTIMLDIEDVTGRRWIDTELKGRIVVAEENASAALEVMSRFAHAPQWLAYLPPTMSPSETSAQEGWLERPEEAFAHFLERGVAEVVCEEKHMGSRAVIALCRSEEAAQARFGAVAGETGAVWTRTGRAFFAEPAMTEALLERLCASADAVGLWAELGTDWLLLDAEIMPWSAKAGSLIESQYGPVAASSRAGFSAAATAFTRAAARGVEVTELASRFADRGERAALYAKAWVPYVWPVSGVGDLKVAPFHLLASEGRVWSDQDHVWHMTLADRLAATGDGVVTPTRWRTVALDDPAACNEGDRLVGGAHRRRWRGHGRQAPRIHRPRPQGPDPARPEGARPRVPAHHLRPRIRRPGQPRPPP